MDGTSLDINYYPYLLCRVGTLPYNLLESIRWKENSFGSLDLIIYYELKKEAQNYKGTEKEFQIIKRRIHKFETNFEIEYNHQQQLHRAAFYALAGNQMLQKGLLQSSPSMWEAIQRYRLKPTTTYRKKERQTERAIAQYIARICTKTSPFSTFTALSINDLSGRDLSESNSKIKGAIRINNYVLAQLEELLAGYPPFYRQLPLKLNPTIRKIEAEYIYLLNSRNIESVQRIEENDVLALIIDVIQQDNLGAPAFSDLLEQLSEKIEASAEQLENYLIDLVRFGLLVWEWPVSGTDVDWNSKLLNWIDGLYPFEGQKELLMALMELEKSKEALPELLAAERWPLIKKSMADLTNCFIKIGTLLPNTDADEANAFMTYQNSELALSPERLFFEDSCLKAEMSWPTEVLEKGIKEIARLTELVSPLRIHSEEQQLISFFEKTYKENETVSLLQFYEAYYKEILDEKLVSPLEKIQDTLRTREIFAEKLSEHIKIDTNFNVHLDLPVIQQILASLSLKVADVPSPKSFGALLQLHKSSNGQYKSYVDAVFTGYGKMLGRFLHLFPPHITIHLSQWIDQLRADSIWVDNTDASFHNANAHPPLLSKSIAIPGGQYNYATDINRNTNEVENTNINLTELSVQLDQKQKRLLLKREREEVTVFNFGLEALPTRSPMFRLLSVFSPWQPDLTPLKVILTKITRTEKNGWIHFPRVNIGDTLVLQRRAWYAPLSDLPLREKSDSEAKYFLRVNHWRVKNQLPETVFITLSPIEVEKNSKDDNKKNKDAYKPQFIDFMIPALVSHLGRALKKVEGLLKIEEVLPGADEMLKVNGKKRVTEFVVQWDS